MKRGILNLIASILFLIIVVFGYYYLWNLNSNRYFQTYDSSKYLPVNISDIKDQAEAVVKERQNFSGIPIPTPTDKVGKTNPFSDPE